MRTCAVVLTTLALSLIACATPPRERALSKAVVLPNGMCAQRGVQAASNDPKGERMFCEFEEPVGSHVPRCVCRDEQQAIADRDIAQQYIRDLEHGKCITNGGGTCN
jgi:hypothetical protein